MEDAGSKHCRFECAALYPRFTGLRQTADDDDDDDDDDD
jgi:hypothetical protein